MSILASTGSVVTYTAILYQTCVAQGLPFFGTYAWTGIWTPIILMFAAVHAVLQPRALLLPSSPTRPSPRSWRASSASSPPRRSS